jgi:hypothetical protein
MLDLSHPAWPFFTQPRRRFAEKPADRAQRELAGRVDMPTPAAE